MDQGLRIQELETELEQIKKELEKCKNNNKKISKENSDMERERNQYLYEILEIRKSFTYKVGRALTFIPRQIRVYLQSIKKRIQKQMCMDIQNEVMFKPCAGKPTFICCEKMKGQFVGLISKKDAKRKFLPSTIIKCSKYQETTECLYLSFEMQSQTVFQAQNYYVLWNDNGYKYLSPIKDEPETNKVLVTNYTNLGKGIEVTFAINNQSQGLFEKAELVNFLKDEETILLECVSTKQFGTLSEVVCCIPEGTNFSEAGNWKFRIRTVLGGKVEIAFASVIKALEEKVLLDTANTAFKFVLRELEEANLECMWRHNAFINKNLQDDADSEIEEFLNKNELTVKGNIFGAFVEEEGRLKIALYQEMYDIIEAKIVMSHTQGFGILSSQTIAVADIKSGKFEVNVPDIDWDCKFTKPINSIWFRVVLVVRDENGIYCLEIKNFNLAEEKQKKSCVYDERKNHLLPFGEKCVCGIPMIAVPYYASNKKLSMKFIRPEQLYRSQFTNELLDVTIKNDIMTVKMRCRNCDGKYLGTLMEYRKVKEDDAETYLIPYDSLDKDGDFYIMTTKIDMKKYYMRMLYWDIRCAFEKDGKVYSVSCHSENKKFLDKFKGVFVDRTYPNDNSILFPYATANNSVALMHRESCPQDHWNFRLKEKIAEVIYKCFKKYWDKKQIYLIFEKYCTMAQDNGFFFFKYCMESNAEASFDGEIWYVLDPKAADWNKILPYKKKVLKYLSLKHMIYLQACKLMISTDTKGHAYVWRSMGSDIKALTYQKKLVFLQHGVTAFKRGHFERGTNVGCECFITTSQFEHDIIHNYLGYPEEEVPITGFSRWDVLKDKSEGHREILMMPTWRTWLDDAENEVFAESDYCKNYMALLNNPKLDHILKEYDVTLNFYLHPKFRKFITEFSVVSDHIRLIPFGEEPLNELMMDCNLLITDFSSVAWDVYYMNKPVLFYHFDLDDAYKTLGFYMDMRNDIFGERAEKPDELMKLIEEYIENGFEMKPRFAKDREKYFAYVDNKNSERIWNMILEREW